VAGTARILKEGEVLFRTGEKADSMYIVRKGSLKVYFLKGNEEVQLALLTDGAVVGEMAFFDQKPRSAHVKALTQTEVMEISRADFDKLLTQIPKWLVTMLQSLSGRLRSTNERLAILEKAQQGKAKLNDFPFAPMLRTLRILQLLTLQIGQKDGAVIYLDYQTALEWWMQLTGWSRDYFSKFIDALQKHGMVQKKGDGAARIYLSGRARMHALTEFLAEIQPRVTHESLAQFSTVWIEMLEAAIAEALETGYESYNVAVLKLSKPPSFALLDAAQRMKCAENLAQWLMLKQTKSNVEVLLKINPKENKNHVVLLKLLHVLIAEGLDHLE
jgi:CRP/FNR family cyclic AMP-dependent transcriptional regulator